MIVTFKKLNMEQFKSQEKFIVEFGPITRVSGRNGAGKSSIGEAVSWLLFGTDLMGSKMDPSPIDRETEENTKVELLLQAEQEGQDPIELLLAKEIVKGTAKYFVNDIPEKAKQFDEVVSQLFDKNLFLSIFNPVYFPSQHWKEQREQLLKYIEEPYKKEILEKMSKKGKEALEELLNKFKVEDLVKKYSPILKDTKIKVERAGERFVTLKEQHLTAIAQFEHFDTVAIKDELEDLTEKSKELQTINSKATDEQENKARFEYELKQLKKKILSYGDQVKAKQAEQIKENCDTCKQPLTTEAIEAVKRSRTEAAAELMRQGKELADQYRNMLEEFKALPDPGETYSSENIQARIYELKTILDAEERAAELKGMVEHAELAREEIKRQLLEAQAIIDACKEYETAKAELMVKKVGALFDRLTVRLFNKNKNGTEEPAFEVEYLGKPYAKLSTAERIKAGLEVVEALINQSQKSLPVFVDNAESIITFKQPSGQLITATVKNSHLVVKQEGLE